MTRTPRHVNHNVTPGSRVRRTAFAVVVGAFVVAATVAWPHAQAPTAAPAPAARQGGRGIQANVDHPVLPIGSPLPDFALPGVDGKTHKAGEYAATQQQNKPEGKAPEKAERKAPATVAETPTDEISEWAIVAAAVVVSEETGVISFVQNGEITRYLNSSSLRELIRNAIEPQRGFVEAVRPARRIRRKAEAATDGSREQVSETYIK